MIGTPTDRLERALSHIQTQLLRLEQDATRYGSPEPGDYPAALGLLLGSVRGRLSLIDHLLDAAREAAREVRDPCTHLGTPECAWCDAAGERLTQGATR